jgi:ParB family chromosome partitioning protein
MGKVRIKEPSSAMMSMVAPTEHKIGRRSIGMENTIGEYFYIKIEVLIPFKRQGRRVFNEEELERLAASITKYGVRQPLTIVKSLENPEKFEVVSGERRMRAAALAGLEKVPCIIMNDYKEAESVALIENIHRADLHPVELAQAYHSLLTNGKFSSPYDMMDSLGINRSAFYETLKILELPTTVQEALINNNISSRDKIRILLKAENPELALEKMISSFSKSGYCRSILRIGLEKGSYSVQKNAIKKLNEYNRERLKEILSEIIQTL